MAGTVQRLAEWGSSLLIDDIPAGVLDLARAQRRSVLGGVAASAEDGACRRVLAGLSADRPDDALYAAAVRSIALDFDDYLCFGHTGHSSVLVPLALAEEASPSGADLLVAQIAASEIEARLGGACLIGPLNGQMWSFIHAAGAALAAGRILGLDSLRLAHALAIALYQPPRPSAPGFMGPDSKLLTAAEPIVMGVRAARLAAGGVTGPLDVLDDRHGFFRTFSYAPLVGMLDRLGDAWTLQTLCVKEYPGCAYVDTIVDALLEMERPDPTDVERVEVHAGVLTCGMDALSETSPRLVPTPVALNFSVPWNVAIVLLAGRLTPDEVNEGWLAANADSLRRIAARVTLHHDWSLTRASLRSFAALVPPARVRADLGTRRLLRALGRARRDHPRIPLDVRQVVAAVRESRRDAASLPRDYWDGAGLDAFTMTFPARVVIHARGRALEHRVDVARGGAGHPGRPPATVAAAKLATYGPRLWGPEGTGELDAAIASDEALELGRLMGAGTTA